MMKINYWIANALLSMGLLAGASTAEGRIVSQLKLVILNPVGLSFLERTAEAQRAQREEDNKSGIISRDLSAFLVADVRSFGNLAQIKSNPTFSQSEREELQQLRQDKQIRDRVQVEVDRTFNRATILSNFLALFIVLFPLGIAISFLLIQRSKFKQITSPKQNELPTEITDSLTKELASLKAEIAKIQYEFTEQINQLKTLYLDLRQEQDKINYNLEQLHQNYSYENNQEMVYSSEQLNLAEPEIAHQTTINLLDIEPKANDSVSNQQSNSSPETEVSASNDVNPSFSADDYLNQGNAHLAVGLYIEANECYNQAVKIERNLAEARYQNARAYAMRGSINPAIGNLQWAIDLDLKYKQMAKSDTAFNYIRHDDKFKEVVKE